MTTSPRTIPSWSMNRWRADTGSCARTQPTYIGKIATAQNLIPPRETMKPVRSCGVIYTCVRTRTSSATGAACASPPRTLCLREPLSVCGEGGGRLERSAFRKARRGEGGQIGILGGAEHRVRHQAPDRRRQLEPVAAESDGDEQPGGPDGSEDRVAVRRDVVEARVSAAEVRASERGEPRREACPQVFGGGLAQRRGVRHTP